MMLNPLIMAAAAYVAADANYSMSRLIMAGCGPSGGTQFVDEGALVLGAATNTDSALRQTTAGFRGPIGTGSVRFDGVLDALSWAHNDGFRLGTSDFAIMFTMLIDTANTGSINSLINHYLTTGNHREWVIRYNGTNSKLELLGSIDGTNVTTLLAAAIPSFAANTEYTVLVEREGDVFRLFVGPLAGTMTCIDQQTYAGYNFFAATSAIRLGAINGSSQDLKGNLSEVYFYVGGTIRHSNASFSTPTTRRPRTTTPATTPVPTFANVKYLVHGHSPDGATSLTDESSSARTITLSGNCQTDTGVLFDGDETILLDGTGDFFTVPDANDFDLGALAAVPTNWCFEAKFRSGTAKTNTIIDKRPSGSATGYSLTYNSDLTVAFSTFSGGSATLSIGTDITYSLSTMHHIAVCRQGNIVRLFANGIMVGIGIAATIADNTQVLRVGRNGFDTARDFNGNLSGIRFSHQHLYDSDFTPPSLPLPNS